MDKITQKQIDANRENAKLGGVKTEEGKAISKYNSLKHGLLSKQVFIKGEDGETLLELEKKFEEEFKPATKVEQLLVDRISSGFWRLQRALSIEKHYVIGKNIFDKTPELQNRADRFFRYETMLERGIYKALHELERVQAKRNGENVPLPVALDVDLSGGKQNGFV